MKQNEKRFVYLHTKTTLKFKGMTKEEQKRKDEIFRYILKKVGVSYAEFLQVMKHNFVASNLDVLTKAEKKKLNVHE